MPDLKSKIVAVVRNYAIDGGVKIDMSTTMREIGVDALDLPMIFLDLEDAVGASLTYDDEVHGFETVADLVGRVVTRLEERRLKALQPRAPKAKRGWMSTALENR